MSAVVEHTVLPPQTGSGLSGLLEFLDSRHDSALVAPDGSKIMLPPEVFEVLQDVVRAMARGQAITVAPRDTVMTTQEAADFLGISRPTLVRLLENGEVPYTRPNRHRRVLLSDLMEYQERMRHERRRILSEMTREASTEETSGDGFVATR